MGCRLNQNDFISRAVKAHGNRYDYSKAEYKGNHIKVVVICSDHGEFYSDPANHWKGHGCQRCGLKNSHATRSLNTESFITKARLVHPEAGYDYSLVDYFGGMKKVEIICPRHGSFWQRSNNHLAGVGCRKCGRDFVRNSLLKEYIIPSDIKLQASGEPPLTRNQRVFVCSCGRKATLSAYSVAKGKIKTCGSCSCLSKEHWLSQKWGFLKLDVAQDCLPSEWAPYSSLEFRFTCSCGNQITARMADVSDGHTMSCGCRIPGKGEGSPVREVEKYITSLGISFISDDRSTISPFEIDILMLDNKLGIEFNGDRWHSLKGTEPPIAKFRHRDKFLSCQVKDILLLQINEHEWSDPIKQEIWKSVISSKLKKHTKRISARKTTFRAISKDEMNSFLEVNHLQGETPSARWRFGLIFNDTIVGVVTFSEHQKSVLSLTRLAFPLNTTVVGGAQKLFVNSLPLLPPKDIVTFSNNRYSNGGLYQVLGFDKDKDLQPSYQWYFHGKMWDKRFFRHSRLLKALGDSYDPSETEQQNMYRNGARCLYDAGYQRWVFHRP